LLIEIHKKKERKRNPCKVMLMNKFLEKGGGDPFKICRIKG